MTRAAIIALGLQTENRLIYATDTKQYFAIVKGTSGSAAVQVSRQEVPYDAGNKTASWTPDYAAGGFQKAALSGATTLLAPANGAVGRELRLWITAAVGGNPTLTFDAAIKIPSDSGLTGPKTLTNGELYILLLMHNGTAWMLVSLVGGY